MKNGYKIFWTDNALRELHTTIENVEENWTQKELQNLAFNIEKTLNLISINPYIYQTSDVNKSIRRVVILSLNTLYYRVIEDRVEILSFFANRQNPKKENLLRVC